MTVAVRVARSSDIAAVFEMLAELADHQGLGDSFEATPDDLAAALHGAASGLHCDIAEWNGEIAGFALWFARYSSFLGRTGLSIEDLFVRPGMRRRGIGKALMRQLARHCVANGYVRIEWTVLASNAQSVEFYRSIGTDVSDRWRLCRIGGVALGALAEGRPAL